MKYLVTFELNDGLNNHKDDKRFKKTIENDIHAFYDYDELFKLSKLKITKL